MKKILKNNLLGFILGAIIFGSIGVVATNYLLKAEDVEYVDKDNNSVTVQSAITDLYSKASSGGYGELTLGTAEASGNSISVSYGDDYIGSACIYGTDPNNYTKVGKIVDNKCVMENLSSTTTYYYKVGVLDTSMKLYIGTGQKETASITYLSTPIEVYFNPVTNAKCNASDYTEANSTTGNSEGCMKWYVYKLEGDYYTMLLDHNTTAISYYNYAGVNEDMGTRSASEIGKIYNEIGYDLNQLTKRSTNPWLVTPKLITETEIRKVTGNTGTTAYYFNGRNSNKQEVGSNIYAWLFDYTNDCTSYGCNKADSSVRGYWTSTKYPNNTNQLMWMIDCKGNFDGSNVTNAIFGLRPVIEVPSSIFN